MKKTKFYHHIAILFWVIGTTTAQTNYRKGYKHPCTSH